MLHDFCRVKYVWANEKPDGEKSEPKEDQRKVYIFVRHLYDKVKKDGENMSDATVVEINPGSGEFEAWDEEELMEWMDKIENLLREIKEI